MKAGENMNREQELRSAGHISMEYRPGQESYPFFHQDNIAEMERCEAIGHYNALYRYLESRSGEIVRTDTTLKEVAKWLDDIAPK